MISEDNIDENMIIEHAPSSTRKTCFAIRYKEKADIDKLFETYTNQSTKKVDINDLSIHHDDVQVGNFAFILAGGRKGDTNTHGQGIYAILKILNIGEKDLSHGNYTITGVFVYFFKPILEKQTVLKYPGMSDFPYIGAKSNISPAISILSEENLVSVIYTASMLTNESANIFYEFFPWLKITYLTGGSISSNSTDNLPVALDIDKIAAVFGEYIINFNPKNNSTMIGVFGKWGRGKTTFFKQIEQYINNKKDSEIEHSICEFQPWKYKKEEEIWAYLYQKVYNHYLLDKSNGCLWIKKISYAILPCSSILKTIKLNIVRHGWINPVLFILTLLSSVILASTPLMIKMEVAYNFIDVLIGTFGISVFFILYKFYKIFQSNKHTAISLYKNYIKFDAFKDTLGFQNEIQEELITLLKVYIKNPEKEKLILFIDDLDRCEEKLIIDTIDTLRLMLDEKEIRERVKVVTAIDERILKKAITYKYTDSTQEAISVNDYIEKFFLIGLKLNDLSQANISELIDIYSKEINNPSVNNEDSSINSITVEDASVMTTEDSIVMTAEDGSVMTTEDSDSNEHELKQEFIDLKISDHEKENLYKQLKELAKLTPRKINIYMHRYLLFKALAYTLFGADIYYRLRHELFLELIFTINSTDEVEKYQKAIFSSPDTMNIPIKGYESENIEKREFVMLMQIAQMVSPF